ncbi:hypothetical protein A11S_1756 [Micavibrio aeruginosavorus EPB]|uniref:Uncharacterized protein n=1 Tax=Micavibrio aeruginosavorus EPB TaxID=349215 RepID=M4VH89_9BACT|nr:hypothetical protein A11S_1756 [Micavibrio aeruginosavorus EPB]
MSFVTATKRKPGKNTLKSMATGGAKTATVVRHHEVSKGDQNRHTPQPRPHSKSETKPRTQ